MLQLCPFKGPSLFCSQNMTGDIYCVYFYDGACSCVLHSNIKFWVKILDVYCYCFIFSDKNLWFSSPWRKGGVGGGDVPALAVW